MTPAARKRWVTARGLAGKFMAVIGVMIVVAEIALHFISWYMERDYEMDHMVVIIGAVIGFVGFWTLDPKETREGAAVLRDLIPRFGRRSSDAVAVPEVKTEIVAKPVPEEPHGEPGK